MQFCKKKIENRTKIEKTKIIEIENRNFMKKFENRKSKIGRKKRRKSKIESRKSKFRRSSDRNRKFDRSGTYKSCASFDRS